MLTAPVALGVATALSWGTGDFCGGLAAKRAPALAIALLGQASSFLLLGGVLLITGEARPADATLAWALAAGLGSAVGTTSLYAALAAGAMALAAPVAALLTAAVPVAVSLLLEGAPAPLQLAGFVLAALAIWMLARPEGGVSRAGLGLALLAGAGFGASLACMRMAGQDAFVWPLFVARASGFAVLSVLVLLRRTPLPKEPRLALLGTVTGCFDTLGNGLFILATRVGRLDVVSALAAQYPASTLLLARLVLKERTTSGQRVGLVLALGAVALLAL